MHEWGTPTTGKYIFLYSTHEAFTKIDHKQNHIESFNTFRILASNLPCLQCNLIQKKSKNVIFKKICLKVKDTHF